MMMHSTNNMGRMDRNRSMLLNKISKAGFYLYDLHLYLDTHPTDAYALRNYEYYQRKFDVLKREYETLYGPLTPKLAENANRWNWIDGPWPWEREYNEE